MRWKIAVACLLAAGTAMGQSDRDFSGSWRLDRSRSSINDMSVPAEPSFRAEQNGASLTIHGSSPDIATVFVYPLDGRSEKSQTGKGLTNTATKWEGSALLVNTIVSGQENYSIAERWERSRDGSTLTITRDVVRSTGEKESVLVYVDALSAPAPAAPMRPDRPLSLVLRPAPALPDAGKDYVVAAGTHILLRLTNAVNTKTTAAGDRIYLETAVPVFVNGRLVIPVGSYVTGTVTEAKRAGRVKGKSALALEYDSITLRTGVARDLRARPDSVGAKGNLDRTEGRIEGDGNKAGDAGRVAQTTAVGTGIGAVVGGTAGHLGAGAGLGAAGGAIAGLASVFGSRGADVVLHPGTTMDMVVDHDLRYTDEDLRMRVQ
jgi:hypothetical protein